MAESKRDAAKTGVLDDEAQKKKDQRTLIMYLVGAVGIVIGVILLVQFLTNA